MLVLSRFTDEQIVIGDNITITVVEIRGDKVKLGIDAPPQVSVHRREVYDAIQRTGVDRRQAVADVKLAAKPPATPTGWHGCSHQPEGDIARWENEGGQP